MSASRRFKLWLNSGVGSNSRSELMALWLLLRFDSSRRFHTLQVWGDSRVTIDWDRGTASIKVLLLNHWFRETGFLIDSFHCINFHHVPRSRNLLADDLSKRALYYPLGFFFWEDWEDDHLLSAGSLDHLLL